MTFWRFWGPRILMIAGALLVGWGAGVQTEKAAASNGRHYCTEARR